MGRKIENRSAQIERIHMMADPRQSTWDLSANDEIALRGVLDELAILEAANGDLLATLNMAAKYFQDADFKEEDPHYAPILAAIAKAEVRA